MITSQSFARIVAEDVRNKATQAQRDYLELPENRERWQQALVALRTNLTAQSSASSERDRDAEQRYGAAGADGLIALTEALAENATHRQRIERFAFFVETRIEDVAAHDRQRARPRCPHRHAEPPEGHRRTPPRGNRAGLRTHRDRLRPLGSSRIGRRRASRDSCRRHLTAHQSRRHNEQELDRNRTFPSPPPASSPSELSRQPCFVHDRMIVTDDLPFDRERAFDLLEEWVALGVTHIVDVRGEENDDAFVAMHAPNVTYVWAVSTIPAAGAPTAGHTTGLHALGATLTDPDAIVLVHCHMGVIRGPSMALRLLLEQGYDAIDALDAIRTTRPIAAGAVRRGQRGSLPPIPFLTRHTPLHRSTPGTCLARRTSRRHQLDHQPHQPRRMTVRPTLALLAVGRSPRIANDCGISRSGQFRVAGWRPQNLHRDTLARRRRDDVRGTAESVGRCAIQTVMRRSLPCTMA